MCSDTEEEGRNLILCMQIPGRWGMGWKRMRSDTIWGEGRDMSQYQKKEMKVVGRRERYVQIPEKGDESSGEKEGICSDTRKRI